MKKFQPGLYYNFSNNNQNILLDIKEIDISSNDAETIKQIVINSQIQTGVYVFV